MLQDTDLMGKCLSLYLGPAASLSQFHPQTQSQKAHVWTISHKCPGALGIYIYNYIYIYYNVYIYIFYMCVIYIYIYTYISHHSHSANPIAPAALGETT